VPAVALFRSLGDPARLAIVSRLAEGEARVVDLTRLLGLAQSTVSKHLACLRGCQLVDFRTEGRQSFYSLTRPELIDRVMTGAAIQLDRRTVLRRRIRLLVTVTITYNVIEAIVAITAGTIASSVALLGFGLDSMIEVSSAAAVAWQFAGPDPQRREGAALRVIAGSFFALAAYGVDVSEIWLINSPQPNHYVDITDFFELKVRADEAHVSQVGHRGSMAASLRERIAPNTTAAGLPAGRLAEAFQVVVNR